MEIGDKVLYTDENGKSFDAEVTRVIDETKQCSVLISGTTKSAELISQESCKAGSKPKKKEEDGSGQEEEPKQAKSETPKEEANTEGKSTEESSDSN